MHKPSFLQSSESWPQPEILSATYGYKGCIGVGRRDSRNKETLRSLGCTVVEHDDGTWETNAVSVLQATMLCGRRATMYMDGLPVTFNYPVLTGGIDKASFVITLSDGSQISPFCYTMAPANEMNEMMTPLLILDGVSSKGLEVVHFQVVGDVRLLRPDGEVVSAKGLEYDGPKLRYQNTGPSLVWASLSVFSAVREAKKKLIRSIFTNGAYPNHCHVAFPATTHVLKLGMDGGSTKDGITGLRAEDTNFFEVTLPDGQPFPVVGKLLGLADLGRTADNYDGDNFFDLCLKLDREDIAALHSQGNFLTVAATCQDQTKLYYPKGDCGGKCGNAACTRSEIQIKLDLGPLARLESSAEQQSAAETEWLATWSSLL